MTDTKESGISVLDTVMELISSPTVITTPDNTTQENLAGSVSINGLTEIRTKANSLTGKNMEKVNGRKDPPTQMTKIVSINMTVITKWTKSMGLVLLCGNQETSIRVTITLMRDKGTEPCSGLTKASSKDIGSKVCSKV